MSSELLYTSAPQGLKAGSRGFTTVLCTAGMPPNLADKLESFSGYKHVYSPQDPLSDQNPVRFAYLRPNVGGRSVAVISRLAAYGVDYSGRSNKIAHHIVLEPNERPIGGPAWLMSQSSLWKTTWDGACKTVSAGPQIPSGDCAIGVCQRWSAVMGDAGWGGQLATWLRQSSKPIWLVYATEQRSQILQLIGESLALLPIEERWKHTFATYFSGLPGDVDCRIRGVVSGSDEARLAAARGHVIDLTKTSELAATSELIVAARTGQMPVSETAIPLLPSTAYEIELPISSSEPIETTLPAIGGSLSREEVTNSIASKLSPAPPSPIEPYEIGPPLVPNEKALGIGPPDLGVYYSDNMARRRSSLRWLAPAIAVAVAVAVFTGLGIFLLVKNQYKFELSMKSSEKEKEVEAPIVSEAKESQSANGKDDQLPAESKKEIGKQEEVGSDEKIMDGSPKADSLSTDLEENLGGKNETTIKLKNLEDQVVCVWDSKEPNAWNFPIKENQTGLTNFKIEMPKGITFESDSAGLFTIDEKGMLSVAKQQDYESVKQLETNLKFKENRSNREAKEINLKCFVTVENVPEIEPVDIPFEITIDSDKNIVPRELDYKKFYKEKPDRDETPFSLSITNSPGGTSEKSIDTRYGKMVHDFDKKLLIFEPNIEALKKESKQDLTAEIDYSISIENKPTNKKIKITIINKIVKKQGFDWRFLKVASLDGDEVSLQFDEKDYKDVFPVEGSYRITFRKGSDVVIGPIVVPVARALGSDAKEWQGDVKVVLEKKSKIKMICLRSDGGIGGNIIRLGISGPQCREMFQEVKQQEIDKWKNEYMSIKSSDQGKRSEGQQRMGEIEEGIDTLKKFSFPVDKSYKPSKVSDLLAKDPIDIFENAVKVDGKNKFIEELIKAFKGSFETKFNEAKKYLEDCELVIEQVVVPEPSGRNNPAGGPGAPPGTGVDIGQ